MIQQPAEGPERYQPPLIECEEILQLDIEVLQQRIQQELQQAADKDVVET